MGIAVVFFWRGLKVANTKSPTSIEYREPDDHYTNALQRLCARGAFTGAQCCSLTWHQSLDLQPTKLPGRFMMLEKGNLKISTHRTAHVNVEHIVTQADGVFCLPKVPKCVSKFQLCSLSVSFS